MSAPSFPPGFFDKVLGALLVGTWGDSMLLAIEYMMAYKYFTKYPKDSWALKGLVLGVLAIDTLSSIGNYAHVYIYTITNWGNFAILGGQQWPVIIFLPTTGLSACIVQMYLVLRLWRLTHNWFTVSLLAAASLASCAGAWSTAIITFTHPLLKDRGLVTIPCFVWLVGSAIADCGIALNLLWQLSKARVSQFSQTRGTITRLMGSAIQTGSAPAFLAIVTLIAFLVAKETNICVGLGFILGRVYALTLIYNLMLRGTRSRSESRAMSHSYSNGTGSAANKSFHPHPHTVELGMGKINVQRTAVVHIDGPEPKSQSNDEVAYSQTLKNPGLEFEHDVRSSYVPRSRSQTPFEGV